MRVRSMKPKRAKQPRDDLEGTSNHVAPQERSEEARMARNICNNDRKCHGLSSPS